MTALCEVGRKLIREQKRFQAAALCSDKYEVRKSDAEEYDGGGTKQALNAGSIHSQVAAT